MDVSEVQKRIVIETVDTKTLEVFKEGRGDSMVASYSASIKISFEGSVGALAVNPDCPIRKHDEHKQRVVRM